MAEMTVTATDNSYGEWILEALGRKGLLQSDLARYLDEDPATISRIISGRRHLRASELAQIARYLGELPPSLRGGAPVDLRLMEVRAMISESMWSDPEASMEEVVTAPAVDDPRFPVTEQYPVRLPSGEIMICAPISYLGRAIRDDDTLHCIINHPTANLIQNVVRTGRDLASDRQAVAVGIALATLNIFHL